MLEWLLNVLLGKKKQYIIYYEPGHTPISDHVVMRNSDIAKELLNHLVDGDSFTIVPPFRVAELRNGQWVEIFGEAAKQEMGKGAENEIQD